MRALRSRQNSSQLTPQFQSVQVIKQKPVVRRGLRGGRPRR